MKLNLELPQQHPSAALLRNYPDSEYVNIFENVSFLYTKNPKLIQKFIDLRADLYSKDPKFVGFRDFQHNDVSDYVGESHITQVLMDGDRCVGGGMLTLCDGRKSEMLPLEGDLNLGEQGTPYLLKNMLPELHLKDVSYVEASRMLVHPDYRANPEFIAKMFMNFYHKGDDMGARYFFAMTDRLRCRMYRKIGTVHAKKYAYLLTHLDLPDRPDFEGVKMQIMVWDYVTPYVEALADRYGKPAL